MNHQNPSINYQQLAEQIKTWASELGFADCGISHTDLSTFEAAYFNWLEQNFHGEMAYMAEHGTKRTRPTELIPGTLSIISLRMNYVNQDTESAIHQLHNPNKAYISRYALGRDYHKVIKQKLKKLVDKIQHITPFSSRIFVDSAPVLERAIAYQAGLGFIGKNSLVIHPRAGSWFFLAEIYTDLPLNTDTTQVKYGCGPCTACIKECPTQAIISDGIVDARRCISYLTIEHPGSIPEEFRQSIGNRIYGCDDCQLVCPWNHFTAPSTEIDFKSRHDLDKADLLSLFSWTETEFYSNLEGSPIRRIGYSRWIRNIAIALGNAPVQPNILEALTKQLGKHNDMIDEHLHWAIHQQHKPSRDDTRFPRRNQPAIAHRYYQAKRVKPTP